MSKVDDIADAISKAIDAKEWAKVDRLQLVLNQLVKIEIAAIEGKKETK